MKKKKQFKSMESIVDYFNVFNFKPIGQEKGNNKLTLGK